MQTVLFHSTIFGPIHSRRLGTSLGINLTPNDGKVCTFDCLYCEAGFNAQGPGTTGMAPRAAVAQALETALQAMTEQGQSLDTITFSGNGEPTVHPDFPGVVDDTLALRDHYFPDAKVSVLSNSTMLSHPAVAQALRRVDNPIMKLDSALDATVRALDRPTSAAFTAQGTIEALAALGPKTIIQTMMVRGQHAGVSFDNTAPEEVEALLEAYARIRPREVMLYSLDRPTPAAGLQKVTAQEMEAVAARVRALGIPVQVNA